jgi:nucleoside-diphosphate-sugar epimerase
MSARSKYPVGEHRLIVTGASGLLGRALIEEVFCWKKVKILALLRQHSRPTKIFPKVSYQKIDFFNREQVDAAVQLFRPTCIIHCAASGMQFARPAWFDMVRFNVDVSLNLCESVSRVPGCRFIYISTGLAYRDQGRPLREEDALDTQHPYGASKAAADILIRSAAAEFGVPLTVFRPFSFSGPGDVGTRLIPSLLRAAEQGRPFHMTSGIQVRDHCASSDIARAVCESILQETEVAEGARVFNLGSGSTLPLRPFVEEVVNDLGLDLKLSFGDRPLTKFEPRYLVADITQIQKQSGWRPVMNFSYAVWQLARETFPTLKIKRPQQWLKAKKFLN